MIGRLTIHNTGAHDVIPYRDIRMILSRRRSLIFAVVFHPVLRARITNSAFSYRVCHWQWKQHLKLGAWVSQMWLILQKRWRWLGEAIETYGMVIVTTCSYTTRTFICLNSISTDLNKENRELEQSWSWHCIEKLFSKNKEIKGIKVISSSHVKVPWIGRPFKCWYRELHFPSKAHYTVSFLTFTHTYIR